MLGAADAPAGTAYVDAVSGFQDLQAFARDQAELGHLVEDGFEIGHLALFFPTGRVDGGAGTVDEPQHDRAGDHRAVPRRGGAEDRWNATSPICDRVSSRRRGWSPAGGLGDVSFGLRGKTPDGARVQMYVWRVGNLVLAISGSGPMDPVDVRALADLLDGRTSVGRDA